MDANAVAIAAPLALVARWSRCVICGEIIDPDAPSWPYCATCEQDERAKWDDWRAEQEQKRRPF